MRLPKALPLGEGWVGLFSVDEEKPAGYYEVEFSSHSNEVRNLSSGIYFYTLTAGKFIETKKMILIK